MYKWTEGEVRECLARAEPDVALEMLKYILERGDRVIDRGNMSLGMYGDGKYGDPDPEESNEDH